PSILEGDMACAGSCPCADDRQCGGGTPRCDKNVGRCVPCLPSSDNCAPGTRCVASGDSFVCTRACFKDADCPRSDGGAAQSCCNGGCLDLMNDTANCGACGRSGAAPTHRKAACAAGSSGVGACDTGFG